MRDIVNVIIAYLTWAIYLVSVFVVAKAFVVALMLPADGYEAAGKSRKVVWAGVLGLLLALVLFLSLSPFGLLGLICMVVAGIFLADVKPAVQDLLQNSSRRGKGPLGLW